MHRLVVGCGQPVGGIDGGMGRDIEEQQARTRPPAESRASGPRLCGASGFGTKLRDQRVQLRRSGARSRWRWRARSRHRAAGDWLRRIVIEHRIQRAALAQHFAQDRQRGARAAMPAKMLAALLTPRDRVRGACPMAPRHGSQPRDAFLGGRMAREQARQSAMQRIDDEHMRRGGIGVGGRIVDRAVPDSIAATPRQAKAAARTIPRRRGRLRIRACG